MNGYEEMRPVLRQRAMDLVVATTGAMALAATSTGFTRASGSFVTDGFRPGMEVLAAGFARPTNNARRVILEVATLTMTCAGVLAEVSDSGRTLSVGLPAARDWENQEFEPTAGVPWVREQLVPGPTGVPTVVPGGRWQAMPLYALHVHVPAGTGAAAADSYAGALLRLFAPGLGWALASGAALRVRADHAPYAGQLLAARPGFVTVPVTVPLRITTHLEN
jgi:hypothetical protein